MKYYHLTPIAAALTCGSEIQELFDNIIAGNPWHVSLINASALLFVAVFLQKDILTKSESVV